VRGECPDGNQEEKTEAQRETPEESEATLVPDEGGSAGLRQGARGETVQREETKKGPMNETTNPDQATYTPLTLPQIGNAFEYLAWGIALFVIYVVVSTAKNR
jgi:hypothetical protein